MSGKYGFGGGIELPKAQPAKPRPAVDQPALTQAVKAGEDLGFVSREPVVRRKPGPKRKEPQDKLTIPGPKRVTDGFRSFCAERNLTLWQGIELLLAAEKGEGA
ncbi:MAG: hypothetical protein AAGG79_03975 [Pseudomonadota bacterium]